MNLFLITFNLQAAGGGGAWRRADEPFFNQGVLHVGSLFLFSVVLCYFSNLVSEATFSKPVTFPLLDTFQFV